MRGEPSALNQHPDWTLTRVNGEIRLMHSDGTLIATIHQEPYAPQIAATPQLYAALDKLTDVSVCAPDKDSPEISAWIEDLRDATREGIAALAMSREEPEA